MEAGAILLQAVVEEGEVVGVIFKIPTHATVEEQLAGFPSTVDGEEHEVVGHSVAGGDFVIRSSTSNRIS